MELMTAKIARFDPRQIPTVATPVMAKPGDFDSTRMAYRTSSSRSFMKCVDYGEPNCSSFPIDNTRSATGLLQAILSQRVATRLSAGVKRISNEGYVTALSRGQKSQISGQICLSVKKVPNGQFHELDLGRTEVRGGRSEVSFGRQKSSNDKKVPDPVGSGRQDSRPKIEL